MNLDTMLLDEKLMWIAIFDGFHFEQGHNGELYLVHFDDTINPMLIKPFNPYTLSQCRNCRYHKSWDEIIRVWTNLVKTLHANCLTMDCKRVMDHFYTAVDNSDIEYSLHVLVEGISCVEKFKYQRDEFNRKNQTFAAGGIKSNGQS